MSWVCRCAGFGLLPEEAAKELGNVQQTVSHTACTVTLFLATTLGSLKAKPLLHMRDSIMLYGLPRQLPPPVICPISCSHTWLPHA